MPDSTSLRTSFLGFVWLIHLQDLVASNVVQRLNNSARPANFDALRGDFRSKTKVNALVFRGEVTSGSAHSRELYPLPSYQLHFCANRITIALMADEFQHQPMILGRCLVAQNMGRSVISRDHRVQPPIIVYISARQSATDP